MFLVVSRTSVTLAQAMLNQAQLAIGGASVNANCCLERWLRREMRGMPLRKTKPIHPVRLARTVPVRAWRETPDGVATSRVCRAKQSQSPRDRQQGAGSQTADRVKQSQTWEGWGHLGKIERRVRGGSAAERSAQNKANCLWKTRPRWPRHGASAPGSGKNTVTARGAAGRRAELRTGRALCGRKRSGGRSDTGARNTCFRGRLAGGRGAAGCG